VLIGSPLLCSPVESVVHWGKSNAASNTPAHGYMHAPALGKSSATQATSNTDPRANQKKGGQCSRSANQKKKKKTLEFVEVVVSVTDGYTNPHTRTHQPLFIDTTVACQ
jgi:hypothetical protein